MPELSTDKSLPASGCTMPTGRFHQLVLIVALFIYVVTAFFSKGYYHADEHYQIIEFAGLKTGTHTGDDLAWEYKENSRQTIQPAMAYMIFSVLEKLGFRNPYTKAFVLRLISALLALVVISGFVTTSLYLVERPWRRLFILLSYFLWFIPVINVRFSSETWSGFIVVMMFSLIMDQEAFYRKQGFLMGVLMGLAFLFRFQSAFLSLALLLWLWLFGKMKPVQLALVLAGGLSMLGLGLVIDTWFYGKLVFTPWTYFNAQILEGMAAGFGESPWYFYFRELVLAPIWPIGLLIVLCIIALSASKPTSPLVWGVLAFMLAHTLISHKEIRFFLPVINLLPLMMVLAWQLFWQKLPQWKAGIPRNLLRYGTAAVLILVNTVALVAMMLKPAGTGRMEITAYIARKYPHQPAQLLHTDWSSPYNPWESVPVKFYQQENVNDERFGPLSTLHDSLIDASRTNLLVVRKADLSSRSGTLKLQEFNAVKLRQSVPEWIVRLNRCYGGLDENEVLVLYQLNK
ncbi:MAG: hypothetical protein KKD74_00705 [Bacteroidetes bacterium]|nr:hypothetical protein [Bacteroidota bacterium]